MVVDSTFRNGLLREAAKKVPLLVVRPLRFNPPLSGRTKTNFLTCVRNMITIYYKYHGCNKGTNCDSFNTDQ